MISKCMECGAVLTTDEAALHRKMFGLGEMAFRCLDCQADFLGVERRQLEEVIARYHASGICALFAKTGD